MYDLVVRTRRLVQDTGRPFAANITVDGLSNTFDLPVESISQYADPPEVVLSGAIISGAATPTYVFDYKYGVIQFFTAPQPAGAILGVSGTTYDFFDDDEVWQSVIDSFNLHVQDQDPLPVIDPGLGQTGISSTENYLVSILAAKELLWMRSTDASQTIDINTPEGVHIPRSQRWRQLIQQISALDNEYKQLSLALGLGIYRIQILNQRRVSYTTNRLVPIFREQEYNTPYSGFTPTVAAVGSQVTINGMYFTGATAVTFGGVSATQFSVLNDMEIVAVVPVGAITGQVGVTTPYGVVLSTAQFVVGQPAPFIMYGPSLVEIPIPPGL
jgi:hypothetical protein